MRDECESAPTCRWGQWILSGNASLKTGNRDEARVTEILEIAGIGIEQPATLDLDTRFQARPVTMEGVESLLGGKVFQLSDNRGREHASGDGQHIRTGTYLFHVQTELTTPANSDQAKGTGMAQIEGGCGYRPGDMGLAMWTLSESHLSRRHAQVPT